MDKDELLWNAYQEHCTWERHHEDQRSSVTNIMIAVAAGILAVIGIDNTLSMSDLPLTCFLIIQGLFGSIFVAKQYECFARHQLLAGRYRQALNDAFPDSYLILLREQGVQEHKGRYQYISRLRLYLLWILLHASFAFFGIILTLLILGVWGQA